MAEWSENAVWNEKSYVAVRLVMRLGILEALRLSTETLYKHLVIRNRTLDVVLFLPRHPNRVRKCLCKVRTLKPRRVNFEERPQNSRRV